MVIREYTRFSQDEIFALYESVGWTGYTERPDMLRQAYAHSLCILGAYERDRLVGILRAVGDGASIVFIQDILVLPDFQRQGVGTALIRAVREKYPDVYQMELLTDDTEKTVAFYRALGFTPASELGCLAFLRM